MTKHHTACLVFTLAATAVLLTASASAQTAAAPQGSIQMALGSDAGTLSDKFVGLARVMAGKYDWRPSPGVRSAGDVFNLIVGENRMLAGLLSGTPVQGGGMGGSRPITDPAEMQEALRSSYATLRQALEAMPDKDLNTSVRMFGRDMTKQGAVLLLLFDQHEHLGQSIAYARSNSVVPPWSK